MRSFLSTLVLGAIASQVVAQSCFSVDGQALDSRYQPCYPQADSSACCMLNGTQGENQQNDLCLDSGLCQSTSGWYAGFLYINGCTDPTGKADGCAKMCSFMGNQYSWNVLQCEPGVFCCREASDTENCCGDNRTTFNTSHIGNLLLPGSTAAINTTFNFTTEDPGAANASSSGNSTCASTSSNSNLIDRSQCPSDSAATVGGAVGGILGAALIGAIVALLFALRSRKNAKAGLATTTATLTSTETQAAEDKANFQKQLEEQQRHVQNMPPNYQNNYAHGAGYSPNITPPATEMYNGHSSGLNELGDNDSRAELTSDSAQAH